MLATRVCVGGLLQLHGAVYVVSFLGLMGQNRGSWGGGEGKGKASELVSPNCVCKVWNGSQLCLLTCRSTPRLRLEFQAEALSSSWSMVGVGSSGS